MIYHKAAVRLRCRRRPPRHVTNGRCSSVFTPNSPRYICSRDDSICARSEQTLIVIATYFCRTLRLRRGKELVGISSVNRERWCSEISAKTVRRWRWHSAWESPCRRTDHRPCMTSCRLEEFLLRCRSSARSQLCPDDSWDLIASTAYYLLL